MSKKSWYAEGIFKGMVSRFSFRPINLKFKAYIHPEKTEIELIPVKFPSLKTRIVDTRKNIKICLYIMGAYKCSSLGYKETFSSIINTNYGSYNTLSGIFPFKEKDIKSFSCDKDIVNIQVKDIHLKYKFTQLQEVKIDKEIKGKDEGFRYTYLLRYEYSDGKIKQANFEVKLGEVTNKLELDYEKFEELKK
jgi:hypothetical protein